MDFRFACLVVLAVVYLAACAPVAQEKEVKLEKRAQEVISYGNQQNAPRLKKRDPALAEGKDDMDNAGKVKAGPAETLTAVESNSGEATSKESGETDAVASVVAAAAEGAASASNEQTAVGDTPEVEGDNDAEVPSNMVAFQESMMGEHAAHTDNDLPDDTPSAPSAGNDANDLLSQLKNEAETPAKEEKEGKKEENETTALARPEDQDDEDYQNYFSNYNLLRKYNSMMGGQGYRPQYPGYTQYYRRRRSALSKLRQARRLSPHGRRIKRDLLDDNEYVYLPYGLPPQYLSQAAFPKDLYPEQWEDTAERPDPEEEQREEILAELMAMKEEEEREEEEKEKEMLDLYSLLYGAQGQSEYTPYLQEEEQPELEEEEELPLYKRQLLSEMPGLKKRYFFPYAHEPETHWPAFVPQKREYDEYGDAYAQVMKLAQGLAREEPRDGRLDSYFNDEKKK